MLNPDDVKEALVAPNSRDKDLIPDQGIRNLDPEKDVVATLVTNAVAAIRKKKV
jgi:hypothetical protein